MLSKIRIHQIFYLIVSIFVVLTSQYHSSLKMSDINSSIFFLFLIIMSFGISHGAADSIIIWRAFTKFKLRVAVFLFYLLIVLLGLSLWFISPAVGLLVLLLMSIFHFGVSDLLYLNSLSRNIKHVWGFVMTLLPVLFFEKEVKSIFDLLTNFDINIKLFLIMKLAIIFLIFCFLLYVLTSRNIKKIDKIFLIIEFLITIVLASFLKPLYWFTFYFCALHSLRGLINIGVQSFKDFFFLILFSLPVTLFSYFILSESLQINYLNIIFSVLMALTISHMLLPVTSRTVVHFFGKY